MDTNTTPTVDALSPLERALITEIRISNERVVSEFKALRWQLSGLLAFLVIVNAMISGVDVQEAVAVLPSVLMSAPAPTEEAEAEVLTSDDPKGYYHDQPVN